MKKDLIVKHNKIIESKYNMSTTEIKIIAKLTSLITKDDKNFKEHIFKSDTLLRELNLGNQNYTALKNTIDKLISKKIRIKQAENKELTTTFLSSCIYCYDSGEVILKYDPELKPYFLQLKTNFTKYHLINILSLKSFYAIRIYELCKQYEKIKERILTIQEIKDMLQIKAKSYDIYNRFKEKVLNVAVKEINEKTDLNLKFKEIKKGRKVNAIKFLILDNKKNQAFLPKNREYSKEVLQLFKNIKKSEKIENMKDTIQELLLIYPYERIESNLRHSNEKSNTNYCQYLKQAVKIDFMKTKREKKELKKLHEKEIEILNKKELEKEENEYKKNLETITPLQQKYLNRVNKIIKK